MRPDHDFEGRMETERRQRLEQAWSDDAPADREVERMRARLLRYRHARRILLPRAVILIAASAICFATIGVLAAQAGKVLRRTEPGEAIQLPAVSPSAPLPRRTPGLPPVRVSDAGREVDLELGEVSPTESQSSSSARSPVPEVDAGAPAEEGEWSRVSEALKRGDVESAQKELDQLSRSADAGKRDAAVLAQAELFLKQGDHAKARVMLERLAESGATAFIRRRAGQLLTRTD